MDLSFFASAKESVRLWEKGKSAGPIERALLMLSRALPRFPYDCLADAPVGYVNRALLQLRVSLFGRQLNASMQCPHCQGQLDLTLDLEPLLNQLGVYENPFYTPILEIERRRFHLPTSRDLAIAGQVPAEQSEDALLQRCCIGKDKPELDLQQMADRVAEQFEQVDPALDIAFDLNCELCGSPVQFAFDIGTYLWLEFEARVTQLLEQVHLLASNYSWSERSILAMSDQRRNFYVRRLQV